MVNEDDWDELAGRPRKGRKPRRSRKQRTKAERLMTNIIVRSRMNFSAA